MSGSFLPLLVILTGLRRVGRNLSTILLMSAFPFFISIGVIMLAREIGQPARFALDAVHGFVVIFYLTTVVRGVLGPPPTGLARFGFSVPGYSLHERGL